MKSIISILILTCTLLFSAEKNEVSGTIVGPTGIIGSVSKNQIQVTDVQKASPADGLLKNGDLISAPKPKQCSALAPPGWHSPPKVPLRRTH